MFISAKTGQRLPKLFDMIDFVIANHAMRIETGVVNEIMAEAVCIYSSHLQIRVRDLNFIILHRFSVKPPTFVIFVNDKQLMHFSYTRYIENKIREAFGFKGTPLRFIIRERKEDSNDLAKDSMCFNRIYFWTVSDRVYYRKDETH